jgi:hypothetical protein
MAKTTKENLCKEFLNVTHVATTTDCWTSSAKSYIGVTAHWFDRDPERQSAALACRCCHGRHMHALLANSLNEIHSEYGIRSKVSHTMTANGSNFVKAFKVFSGTKASETDGDDDDDVDELDDEDSSHEFHAVEIDNILILQTITDEDNDAFSMSPHHQCASHTLNLVVTSDC